MIVVLILQLIVLALSAINAAISAFFTVCVVLGAGPARHVLDGSTMVQTAQADENTPRTTVVIPAHNEQSVIGETLRLAKRDLPSGFQILVVADNCSDDTASIVRNMSVRVLERNSEVERGKGFALAAAFQHLAMDSQPPEVAIVLDADSRFDAPDTSIALAQFASACLRQNRPLQMISLLDLPAPSSVRQRIAAFAFRVKGLLRNAGLHRIGGGCSLGGTGMAFPFELVKVQHFETSETVEDMRLGIELALAGVVPRYFLGCSVRSPIPASETGFVSQRTRWEQGHIRMIARYGLLLLVKGLRSWPILLMGADLSVPPLSLHTLLTGAMWCVSLLAFLFGWWFGSWIIGALALSLTSISVLCMLSGVLVAKRAVGQGVLEPGDLGQTLHYALSKVGIYARTLWKRERRWVRTERM